MNWNFMYIFMYIWLDGQSLEGNREGAIVERRKRKLSLNDEYSKSIYSAYNI